MKYSFVVILAYFILGALLGRLGIINKLYLYSEPLSSNWGWVKFVNNTDSSTVSSDGPILIQQNGKWTSYAIVPKDGNFVLSKTVISRRDTLRCYVDEPKQSFWFLLQNNLVVQPSTYAMPTKLLAISDIEGNFWGFKAILKGANVIDDDLNWTFGNGHLVLVGDFFDRGLNVTECLWLIYKLETEAEKNGGKVHFLLGNHEVMNLKGAFKYVRNKYWHNADTLQLDYEKWYAKNTELGKWLRTKNSVEKIGDFLFAHGGINRKLAKKRYSLAQINDNTRESIDEALTENEAEQNPFTDIDSPVWYRGIVQQRETQQEIEQTLKQFNATKMIVGHTIVNEIKYLYNQKVIALDLDHKTNAENGKMYALWFENERFFVIDHHGNQATLGNK